MYKKLGYIFIFILMIISGFSVISEEVPDECKVQFLNETAFEEYLSVTSFFNVTQFLVQDIIDSNFTIEKIFDVQDFSTGINIRFIFSNTDTEDGRLGTYSSLQFNKGLIYIFVKEINDYAESLSATNNDKIVLIQNVIMHELTHYIYQENKGLYNISSLFNIETSPTNLDVVTNQDYFIDLYNQTFLNPPVKSILRSSLNFTWVFENYPQSDSVDEVIARINAVCLEEVQNSVFTYNYPLRSAYCSNFNLLQEDADTFSIVTRTFMEQYYFDMYPENRITNLLVNEDFCKSYVSIENFMDIINFLIGGTIDLMIKIDTGFILIVFSFGVIFIIIGLKGYIVTHLGYISKKKRK